MDDLKEILETMALIWAGVTAEIATIWVPMLACQFSPANNPPAVSMPTAGGRAKRTRVT